MSGSVLTCPRSGHPACGLLTNAQYCTVLPSNADSLGGSGNFRNICAILHFSHPTPATFRSAVMLRRDCRRRRENAQLFLAVGSYTGLAGISPGTHRDGQ